MDKDFLDDIVADRASKNADFPRLVAEAEERRVCGASIETLLRRQRYGGRKGRRAKVRLRKRGWPWLFAFENMGEPIGGKLILREGPL